MTGTEQVLINDWCQQFPSHSIGTLLFGRDGYLYVTGGDGASFNNVDYGQYGNTYAGDQANPCGDPPGAVGTPLSPPGAEGGALRSQSVRRTDGPATLDGTVLRVDPSTGAGVPGNPFFASSDPNARRIVAYGLRNPFRITQRPGTDELWIGDVGWNTWEEINRVVAPASAAASNFGWPCYEGTPAQGGYQGAGLSQCSSLYSTPGSVVAPYYAYNHGACVVNYTGCHTGGSSITGVAFYQSGSYPTQYNGALFFADHTRNEIWAMLPGTNGLPDPSRLQSFVGVDTTGGAAGHPVDLKIGPGGDLFYVDMDDGTVHRISFAAANQPPTAVVTANPTNGPVPLTVSFGGTGSSDPEGKPLSYSWDLNGDGTFKHRADRGHRLAHVEPDVEGRRRNQLLRPRHRPAGGHPAGVGADLVTDPSSLFHADRLPHAPAPDHQRRLQRIGHRAGPCLPVLARAATDCHRLGRAGHDD
jgi:glucose/arabinose dehydrogenase